MAATTEQTQLVTTRRASFQAALTAANNALRDMYAARATALAASVAEAFRQAQYDTAAKFREDFYDLYYKSADDAIVKQNAYNGDRSNSKLFAYYDVSGVVTGYSQALTGTINPDFVIASTNVANARSIAKSAKSAYEAKRDAADALVAKANEAYAAMESAEAAAGMTVSQPRPYTIVPSTTTTTQTTPDNNKMLWLAAAGAAFLMLKK